MSIYNTATPNSISTNIQLSSFWLSTGEQAATYRLNLASKYHQDFSRLDLEFPNLQVSISWLKDVEFRDTSHTILGFLEIISPYLKQRSLNYEMLEWCNLGIKACTKLNRNPVNIYLLKSEAHYALGQWDQSLENVELGHQQSNPNSRTWGETLFEIGRIQLNRGNYRIALRSLYQAERFWQSRGNYKMLAKIKSEIAAYHLNRMELQKALSLFIEVDHLEQKLGGNESSDQVLLMLGVVNRRLRKYDAAITYLQKLVNRYDITENPSAVATATHHLAWVYLNLGKRKVALELCFQSIKLYKGIEDPRGLSDAYEQLAMIHLAEGSKQKALETLKMSLKLRQELGNQHGVASCLRHLGTIKMQTKDWLEGVKEILQSFILYWKMEVLGRQRTLAIIRELFEWLIGKKKWTV